MNFTNKIESKILSIKNNLSSQQIYGFVAALIAGIVAHGYVIFNRISYHDNTACLFNLGGTYESGRWMLGFVYDLQMMTTKLFSVPVFNGLLSIVFIAIAVMLVIDLFKVNSKFIAGLIGVIMVVYPVVASIFSFMFTSWEYQLGLILSVLSAKVLIEKRTVGRFICAAILLAVCLGFYQAFMSVTIALFLITLFFDVLDDKFGKVIDYIKTGLIYLTNLAVGLVLWAIMRKVTMAVKHISAVDYKGMDEGFSLSKAPQLFVDAFKAFFTFGQEGINAVLYQRAFTALIVVIAIVQIIYLLVKKQTAVSIKLVSIIGLILLPLGMNVVYLLSTSSEYNVDSVMVYGDIFIYIMPLLMLEKLEGMDGLSGLISAIVNKLTWLQLVLILVMTIGYTYMDNAAYMKGEIAQEQAIAYFNQLITSIKSCEGFEDDMEIVLVGWSNLEDGTFAKVDNSDQLEAIKITKFPRYTDLVKYEGSIYFLREHLGFGNENVIIDDGTVAAESAVKAMPTYPNDGAIAVIDGRVIVKLGE